METQEVSERPLIEAAIQDELKQGSKVHVNVAQTVIVTTMEKLTSLLDEHERAFAAASARNTTGGMLLSLLLPFVTADFKDWLGIPAATWEAVDLVLCAVLVFFFLRSLYEAWRTRKYRKRAYIERALSGENIKPSKPV